MHYFGAKTLTVATSSLLLLSLSFLASADAVLLSDRRPLQAKSASLTKPYQLNLSLVDYRRVSADAPYIALNITNRTQNHLLLFIWRSPEDVVYNVEYKAPTDDPSLDSGWKELKPDTNAVPSPSEIKPSGEDGRTQSSSYAQRFIIKSGQTGFGESYPPDVPLPKQGYYRITAVLTIPEAREFSEPASNASLLRIFTLLLHSQPLVIRRTVDGFVTVDLDTVKKAVPVPK